MGAGFSPSPERHVRICPLGQQETLPACGARPLRRETILLLPPPVPRSLCFRNKGHTRLGDGHAGAKPPIHLSLSDLSGNGCRRRDSSQEHRRTPSRPRLALFSTARFSEDLAVLGSRSGVRDSLSERPRLLGATARFVAAKRENPHALRCTA